MVFFYAIYEQEKSDYVSISKFLLEKKNDSFKIFSLRCFNNFREKRWQMDFSPENISDNAPSKVPLGSWVDYPKEKCRK